MQSESFGIGIERQALNVVDVLLKISSFNRVIQTALGELIPISHDISVDIVL
jgi:hypothetical protein